MTKELARLIDEMAANAWPAPVQQQLEGWRLRAADGVTRRANSVLTIGEMPSFDGWLGFITEFYVRRGLPVRFQVSEASPPGLKGMLDNLGFVAEAHTSTQVADCQAVLERPRQMITPGVEIASNTRLDEEWLSAFVEIEGITQGKIEAYRQIMSGIGPKACYVQVREKGETVGIGSAVAERGWAGLFNIATVAGQRRRGIGEQVVRALARWGQLEGAEKLYLQVMRENEAALGLYRKLGFSHLYEYHYCTSKR